MSLKPYLHYYSRTVGGYGDVPTEWCWCSLKRLVESIESGVSVNAIDVPASDGEGAVLKTSCVYGGKFLPEENKAIIPEERSRAACPVRKDSLIVSRMNTPRLVGSAGLVKESDDRLFLPDRLWQVRFVGVLPSFVYYWTQSAAYRHQVEKACDGTSESMQNLSQGAFLRFALAVPPEAQQIAVVDFLDRETAKIDALIAEQEKLIVLLAEKRRATISYFVTQGLDADAPKKDSQVTWLGQMPAHWSVTRLKHATSLVVDCPHETPVYDLAGGYKVIRTADIDDGRLSTGDMLRVSKAEYLNRIRRQRLYRDDVVYSREGERWGFAALVPEDDLFCLGQRMMQFRASEKTCARYLMWQLNAVNTYRQGQMDTVGATSPHVNVETIRNYALAEPSLGEQRQIAAFLDHETTKLEALAANASRGISLLQERRAALITAAVTGQIDVRDVVATRAAADRALCAA